MQNIKKKKKSVHRSSVTHLSQFPNDITWNQSESRYYATLSDKDGLPWTLKAAIK